MRTRKRSGKNRARHAAGRRNLRARPLPRFALALALAIASFATTAAADFDLPEANRATRSASRPRPPTAGSKAATRCGCCGQLPHRPRAATSFDCEEAVLWIDHAEPASRRRSKVIAYLEGDVDWHCMRTAGPVRLSDQTWFGRSSPPARCEVHGGGGGGATGRAAGHLSAGHGRATARFRRAAEHAIAAQRRRALQLPRCRCAGPAGSAPVAGHPCRPGHARRRPRLPRGDVPVQAQWLPDPRSNQWIAVSIRA